MTCDLAMASEVDYHHDQGQEEKTYNFKILVPSVAAGAIIGKKGEMIVHLQQETGAKVKMSKATDFYPGTAERVCLITGSVEAILIINEYIMSKIMQKPDPTAKMAVDFDRHRPVEREKQVKILVPNSTASMIIGKGGNYIKQIKEISGSYIQISQNDKGNFTLAERCITVIGEMESNKIACQMILTKIIKDPNSGICPYVSYANVTGPVPNFDPVGSPFAKPNNASSGAINTSNTNPSSAFESLSPISTSSFQNLQTGVTHSGIMPFVGGRVDGSAFPFANIAQAIENFRTTLKGKGYSEQATSEISSAINTLANYGLFGNNLDLLIGAFSNNSLEGAVANSSATNYPLPPVITNQGVYASISSGPGAETASSPMEPSSNMFCSNEPGVVSSMSFADSFGIQTEATAFHPFQRNSPTLASPSAAALPMHRNPFEFRSEFSPAPPSLRNTISIDPPKDEAMHVNIEVEESVIGAILGPGGTFTDIERFSHAHIKLSKKEVCSAGRSCFLVTIFGDSSSIKIAQYLIELQIAQEEAKRNAMNFCIN